MAHWTDNVHRMWWKEASVYHIYPASFKDSNGDGIGDIPGIVSKLDYIKSLGVDILWICPCYKSPKVDMGYDVSGYRDIDEQYGTMNDIEQLLEGLHSRGMKLVIDMVANHTSDQHDWFKSALASKDSPYRDYYIWKKPKIGENGENLPPNNWLSLFSGSVWKYDEKSDEFYFHLYATAQPDLNWENPKVRQEIYEIMRFWIIKGVDGFRMDAINFISKDPAFPDAPITVPSSQYQPAAMYYSMGPRLHDYVAELGKFLKEHNAFSVGEMAYLYDPAEVIKIVNFDRNELNMVFQFELIDIDRGPFHKYCPKKWTPREFKDIVNKWQVFMQENDGWNALFLENHDWGRSVSRFLSDKNELRKVGAKMLATFIGLQSGTLFLYQGEVLGLANMPKSWPIERYKDLETINYYKQLVHDKVSQETLDTAMGEIQRKARDHARLPFEWDSSDFAGFSSVQPWMDVNEDYKEWNAAVQVDDPSSVFSYWRSILDLRRTYKDVLVYGKFELVDATNEKICAYRRVFGCEAALVVTSFSDSAVTWIIPHELLGPGKIVLSNYGDEKGLQTEMVLRPYEAFLYILSN
ncbi:glycoside hydrolase superfamily [Lipomyces chichibuensis]|uniref:glycoside hydrolase superfamily n=1 Tax=Lipomyces chichibuensis TaxID=1546026 RepID=UPI003343A57B